MFDFHLFDEANCLLRLMRRMRHLVAWNILNARSYSASYEATISDVILCY